MKATGMIRRIDDLGRVVIPKEIRKTLNIKVGDELEIYTEDNGVLIMRKHSRMIGFGNIGKGVISSIYRSLGGTVLLSDMSNILCVAGANRQVYEGKELSDKARDIIELRRGSILRNGNIIDIVDGDSHAYEASYIAPIMSGGDVYGALIMLANDDIDDAVRVLDTASSFLALGFEV